MQPNAPQMPSCLPLGTIDRLLTFYSYKLSTIESRGTRFVLPRGIYFYGDNCSGRVWGLKYVSGAWQSHLLKSAGFSISSFGEDEAGNLWATLKGKSDKTLLIGGHMDSVPNGGWLDGCLNVLAGVEVLRRIAGQGTPQVKNIMPIGNRTEAIQKIIDRGIRESLN